MTFLCVQVHFKAGVGGDECVEVAAAALCSELDAVGAEAREQAAHLEAANAQVEAHAAELQKLRALVLEAEQRLRTALAPVHQPRDPEAAAHEQQVNTSFYHSPNHHLDHTPDTVHIRVTHNYIIIGLHRLTVDISDILYRPSFSARTHEYVENFQESQLYTWLAT